MVVVVQSISCPILFDPMDCSTPGFLVLHYPLEFAQAHVHWVGDAIQPSHPLLSTSPPAFNLSQHQGFFPNESVLRIRWPKYWSFSFSTSPSNEYSGLISSRIDWLDLLAVQGILESSPAGASLRVGVVSRGALRLHYLGLGISSRPPSAQALPSQVFWTLSLGCEKGLWAWP